jgi:hypothetical protein
MLSGESPAGRCDADHKDGTITERKGLRQSVLASRARNNILIAARGPIALQGLVRSTKSATDADDWPGRNNGH